MHTTVIQYTCLLAIILFSVMLAQKIKIAYPIVLVLISGFCEGQDVTGLRYPADPAQQEHSDIPKGEVLQFKFNASKIFPGTERTYWIYVPAEYKPDKPACLYVDMDGVQFNAPKVFDYLINKGEMPVTIGVFISSGVTTKDSKNVVRYNRSHEFDSMNADFINFLLTELLPDVEKQKAPDGHAINFSKDPNDHAIAGASSGAICAFTAAWQRPDVFNRVFSTIGTYIGMRGGDQYPILVRKTEPKPLRVFLQDNASDAWNPLFGSWYTSNLNMEAALNFAGYEVAHSWGSGGHSTQQADAIFPDVMRWLWKGWPQRVKAGKSNNDMLGTILVEGEGWKEIPGNFRVVDRLISASKGDVLIQDIDGNTHTLNFDGGKIGNGVKNQVIAYGPDEKYYILDQKLRQLSVTIANAKRTVIAKNISGSKILVTQQGNIYVLKPATNDNEKGEILLIKPGGSKIIVDSGLRYASAITISPDHNMLLVAENNTNWIYNYIIQNDGSLKYKQKWYWLHQTDNDSYSLTNDIAMDSKGNLYAATNAGIQVCDQNGRVRIILQPPGSETITALCFGGENHDTLFVLRNGKLYKRKLKINGIMPWGAPSYPQSIGAG